jgi:hypothetical protein
MRVIPTFEEIVAQLLAGGVTVIRRHAESL